ncbi:MAG: NADH-quinone oxidoreductase subunit N [Candidatus Omnitrophica bacterium]|nr:NADH-quinone oxidoreductase subunit N [Candidatus Omnitrophota bacterium]
MTSTDFLSLLPFIVLSVLILALMGEISYRRDHALVAWTTLGGFLATLVSVLVASQASPHTQEPLLAVDGFGLFFIALLVLASLPVAALAKDYLEKRPGYREEFYMLLCTATLGGMILVSAIHFATVFIGLELLTLSLFGMIAYTRTSGRSIEAGIKYLVLAAISSSFLIFGLALIYFELGGMGFAEVLEAVKGGNHRETILFAGFGLTLVGAGFKLALVPFHMWTPDIYEGAPAPVTAYIATASKGAMTGVLLRLYLMGGNEMPTGLWGALAMISVASMFTGNLLALLQENIKRILAYSSISHLGYLLVAFLAGGTYAVEAVVYYLVAYMATSLGAFGVVSVLANKSGEIEELDDYRGLGWRHPFQGGVLTAMLLSLAGIPLTAGFVGKFYLVAAGVDGSTWWLLFFLVLNSAIGLYYYLRVVATLYDVNQKEESTFSPLALSGGVVLAILTLVVIGFGVLPGPFIAWIRDHLT